MRVSVLVTLLDDRRVLRTLESLKAQTQRPFEVLVADGGAPADLVADIHAVGLPGLRMVTAPGSVAETRAVALGAVRGDAVAFLDTDQVAPPGWLAALAGPVASGEVDVAGGPTRPLAPAASKAEAYVNAFEAWYYDQVVAHDPTRIPMGNSLWRMTVFGRVGGFDPLLRWGGEDWDLNLRAALAGFQLRLVPEAWVHHDQAHLDSLRKVLRRRHRYAKGATVAYLKNRLLAQRLAPAAATARFRHPYEWLATAAKPFALVAGVLAWIRLGRPRAALPLRSP